MKMPHLFSKLESQVPKLKFLSIYFSILKTLGSSEVEIRLKPHSSFHSVNGINMLRLRFHALSLENIVY